MYAILYDLQNLVVTISFLLDKSLNYKYRKPATQFKKTVIDNIA